MALWEALRLRLVTTGPFFGGAFNPANVTARQVGTATFTLLDATTARLVYTVDGVSVTKNITRQTWRTNTITGPFVGGRVGNYTNCTTAASNGFRQEEGNLSILQIGAAVSIFLTGAESCTFNGTYAQAGRIGTLTAGTYSCNSGTTGTFTATEIEASLHGMTMRMDMQSNLCHWNGRMGGLRAGTVGL